MPITLARLTANKAAVAIDFGGGDVLNVEFYPAKITGKMMADLASVDTSTLASLAPAQAVTLLTSPTDMLTSLLASWDLADSIADDGAVTLMPLDHDHIEALGINIQWTILNGVLAAQQGEAKAPEASVSAPASDAIS
jgi:hypothetical protein